MQVTFTPINVKSQYREYSTSTNKNPYISYALPLKGISADTVFFGSKVITKYPDIPAEVGNLVKKLDTVLKSDGTLNIEDRVREAYNRMLRHREMLELKTEMLEKEVNEHLKRTDRFSASYQSELRRLLERCNQLKKQDTFNVEAKVPTYAEMTTDYNLVNKFKTSIVNEHYDLQKVFNEHYQGLNTIKSVKELKEKYPKLVPIKKPEEVVADKLLGSLTRDYFEKINELMINNDKKALSALIYAPIKASHNPEAFKKFGIDSEKYDVALAEPFTNKVLDKYNELEEKASYSYVPIIRKKKPVIDEHDYKLLAVNFDDFNLHVFKEIYQNGKRFKDITYKQGNIEIQCSKLKGDAYVIDDVPRMIKDFIKDAKKIQNYERDYENFTWDKLKDRLSYYADRISDSEFLLGKMIDFISCRFHEDDKKMLLKFLKELDSIWDGEKSIKAAEKAVHENNIKPLGTEKLNLQEHNAALIAKKEEAKLFKALQIEQSKFDNAINLLYQNNMNYCAEICSKYRPKSTNPEEIETAKKIVSAINRSRLNKNSGIISEKGILEEKITRWDTYNTYLASGNETKLFETASNFARRNDGSVDTDKAGKYLINYEIVKNFPHTKQYYKAPELLEKIIVECNNDRDMAIRYICKYDEYTDLSLSKKSLLKNYIDKFDMKDNVDKVILKYIIEKEYMAADTVKKTLYKDKNSSVSEATITLNAKREIMDYYRFPSCVDLFINFEEAMGNKAAQKGSAGIKKLIAEPPYMYELKIMGAPVRLLAKSNLLVFDTFHNKGFGH